MRTVYTNRKIIEFNEIDEKDFKEKLFLKRLSFGIVKNDKDRADQAGKSQWCFMPFESAFKIALKHNQIVVSQHFWENKKSAFLIYYPSENIFKTRTEFKIKEPVRVSEQTYQNCLFEINGYKENDRQYNWIPNDPNYYNIENWTFDIKDGKLQWN